MTREQAIEIINQEKKHCETHLNDRWKSDEYYKELNLVESYDMAIKALEHEQKWIPVSERLPEQPYSCLVTIEYEEPMTGQLFETILPYFVGWDGERWNDADGEQCPFEVIAWMPLPEPYKAESEKDR